MAHILKYLKFATLVLVILAVLAVVTHFYRESIALRLANSALSGQGITATELSIQTLSTDYVRLSQLVLEQDNGTRYRVSGLEFPVSFPSLRAEKISIEHLVMLPAESNAAPAPLARSLQAFLRLPDIVPNTEVTVSRFTMPGTPPVEDILWRSGNLRQHFAFSIHPVDVIVDVERVDDDKYQLDLRAAVGGVPGAFFLKLTTRRSDSGFSIDGLSAINLSPWLPLLKSIGILPAEIVSFGAELGGPVTIVLDDDETRPVSAAMQLSVENKFIIEYEDGAGNVTRTRISVSDPLQVNVEYPTLDWTAGTTRVDAIIEADAIGDIPVQLGDLECRSGIRCEAQVSLVSGPIDLNAMSIASVIISPSLARLIVDDTGWRSEIDQLNLTIDSLTDREALVASLPVTLNKIRMRGDGTNIDAEVSIEANTATLSRDGVGIVAPGMNGKISLTDGTVAASLELSDIEGAMLAQVDASHRLATGTGMIAVRNAVLNFDRRNLSGHVLKWPFAWDVVSGTLTTNLELSWQTGDTGTQYQGSMTQTADALAGAYNDIVFTGLATALAAQLDSAGGVAFSPSSIEVALLDVGVPVEQITADFALNIGEKAVQIQNLSMSVLGGQLVTEPFRFGMQEEINDIILRPQSIQLQFMLDIAEFEDISLSGSLSGVLPVTISNERITMQNGRLESDPPGGVIRYSAGGDTQDATVIDSDIGLVSRALANFEFDSLTADVDYTKSGDLKLQMILARVSPDMDANQPIILNLDVENDRTQ